MSVSFCSLAFLFYCSDHGEVHEPHCAQSVIQEPQERHQEALCAQEGPEAADEGGKYGSAPRHIKFFLCSRSLSDRVSMGADGRHSCSGTLSRMWSCTPVLGGSLVVHARDGPEVSSQPADGEEAQWQGPLGGLDVLNEETGHLLSTCAHLSVGMREGVMRVTIHLAPIVISVCEFGGSSPQQQ
eukprot:scaffold293686_cov45-Tisochrysis_lutea.AAC.1